MLLETCRQQCQRWARPHPPNLGGGKRSGVMALPSWRTLPPWQLNLDPASAPDAWVPGRAKACRQVDQRPSRPSHGRPCHHRTAALPGCDLLPRANGWDVAVCTRAQRKRLGGHAKSPFTLRSPRIGSMVDVPLTLQADRMSQSPPTLTVADIHSVYSGKKVESVVEHATRFQSTKRFARDAAHTGQAPSNPRDKKGAHRR